MIRPNALLCNIAAYTALTRTAPTVGVRSAVCACADALAANSTPNPISFDPIARNVSSPDPVIPDFNLNYFFLLPVISLFSLMQTKINFRAERRLPPERTNAAIRLFVGEDRRDVLKCRLYSANERHIAAIVASAISPYVVILPQRQYRLKSSAPGPIMPFALSRLS